MTAVRREHAGAAAATTLVAQLTAGTMTFDITDATGWPTGGVGEFVVTIGAGTATEERILCTSRTTTTITVSERGWENTGDQLHAAGADVVHTFSATEADEANIAAVAVVAATGGLVGRTQTQTLTGKTVDLGSNTVTGTKAQFNTALSDGDFATLAGTEALTNKDLSDGTNTFPASAPKGLLGYTEKTTDQSGIGTETDLTDLAVTVTVAASRRVKVSAFIRATPSGNGDVYATLKIKESATVLQANTVHTPSTSVASGVAAVVYLAPSAGAHTYKLSLAKSGIDTATLTSDLDTTSPGFILVEDIGAA